MPILKPYFSFGDRTSLDLRLSIESKDIFDGAADEVDTLSLPGRDGAFLDSKSRSENTEITYETFLKAEHPDELPLMTTELKRWLLSSPGQYRRLEDTYDPDHYRMAAVLGGLSIEQAGRRFTRQSVTFSCHPYRYRKSGEHPFSFESGLTLQNDTGFTALPTFQIKVTASSNAFVTFRIDYDLSLGLSPYTQSFDTPTGGTLTLDSETCECTLNSGNLLYLAPERFPKLHPGKNTITVTGYGITARTLTPHWREK